MRRSEAPSARSFKKPKLEDEEWTKYASEQNHHNPTPCSTPKKLNDNKIVYNIQWREQSNRKHKTWKGNGILEIDLDKNRGVLTDHVGKYMGSTTNINREKLIEGFQMRIGKNEIELLEQIENQQEYWEARKLQTLNRGWGTEEWQPAEEQAKSSKQKGGLCFVPNICLNPQKSKKARKPETNQTQRSKNDIPLKVSENLMKLLRPHQKDGVAFLCESLMGSRGNHFGCILADEMGLGKTLQVLTASHTLLRYESNQIIHRILVVTPRSLISNWDKEIHKWLLTERMFGFVVEGSSVGYKNRLKYYNKQPHMPFVISSYETLLSQLTDFQQLDFDLLVCDEGHRLKNSDTKIYKALQGLNIKRRIVLTGTPVQNNLSEFFALADFVNPGILGSLAEFRHNFELPIERGQCATASEEDRNLGEEKSEQLNSIISSFLLRRLNNVNLEYLSKKHEYICFIAPSKFQSFLLSKAFYIYEGRKETIFEETTALEMIATFRKICNHPHLLKRSKKENPFVNALTRYIKREFEISDSAKLILLRHLLITATVEGREKIVLVSYHTKTLDILQSLCDELEIVWLRLDGATPPTERNGIVSKFNSIAKTDCDALVLLLSAKAGGVGLNLVGASRLVLYDIDWNPANDAQALSRIWRDGQRSDVHIYRFITAGTIEEKIFQRQVIKLNLGDFLISSDIGLNGDSSKQSMKFTPEELQALFSLQSYHNDCDTHHSMKCECAGVGENGTDTPTSSSKGTRPINELMQWKHWKSIDTNESFMRAACLWNARDELIYLFSSQTRGNANSSELH